MVQGIADQKFNDDLLISEEDRELAAGSFPGLAPALDFPELRELFTGYDKPSNQARKNRRRAGVAAVACGVLALLGVSAEPLILVRRAPTVLASVGNPAAKAFWLLDDEGPPAGHGARLDGLFAAYRLFRFQHQLQYAGYKLRDSGLNAPLRQVAIPAQIGLTCILIVFVVHFMIALSLVAVIREWLTFVGTPWVRVLVIWTAIVALAARALEEGLQPVRDVERYTRYRSALSRLSDRFDRTPDPAAKFLIMRETEGAVYGEMRAFLKTNYEARFVL